jgi:hypothetical protein
MAGLTTNDSPVSHHLARLMLGLVVAAHFGFNLLLNPIGVPVSGSVKWRMLMFVGATIAQPALFAIWASLGPGPSFRRILWTTAAFGIVIFGEFYIAWNLFARTDGSRWGNAEFLFFPAALYAVCAVGMTLVRKLTRWRITHVGDSRTWTSTAGQFSLKFILGYTAVCAALLGAARLFSSAETFGPPADRLATMLTQIGGILLVIFPTFIAPLATLAKRVSVSSVVALLFLWVVLSLLAVEAVLKMNPNEIRSNVVIEIGYVQFGAALTGVFSALMLRWGGYRFVALAVDDAASSPAT